MFYRSMVLMSLVFAVGCASSQPEGKATELSKVGVEKNLIKGTSTRVDVVKLLGSPEMINTDSEKREQWVYSKSATEWNDQHGSIGLGGLNFLSSAVLGVYTNFGGSNSTKETKMKTLVVNFDEKGLLESYNFSYSKI